MHPSLRRLVPLSLLAIVGVGLAAAGPTFRLRATLLGQLGLTPAGTNVTIGATVQGLAVPLGPSTAIASWTTDATRLDELRTGVRQELTIGSGQLHAQVANGSTVQGTFGGTLRRTATGDIEMDAAFTVTGGTGLLAQATGSGTLLGLADPATLAFELTVHGTIHP